MPILELKTKNATFIIDDRSLWGHFAIDCSCGGKDGKYNGSHYKNAGEILERQTRRYQPLYGNKLEHTFYLNEIFFLPKLHSQHQRKPVIIVCNDCSREFPFTHESYLKLRGRIKRQYLRSLSKQKTRKSKRNI